MTTLVVNAGSSSVKLRLIADDEQLLASADLPASALAEPPIDSDPQSPARLLAAWQSPRRVIHRVVHGGTRFGEPVLIDRSVRAALAELVDLAPLHQPKSLAGIDAVTALLPDVPAYVCFDTAFHRTIPNHASTYAIPAQWRTDYGVRRYGFHGLSHAYCSEATAAILDTARERTSLVSCHIGAGASVTAVVNGRSVDTTMGFTPLDGVVMATRSGSIDPGLVLWLEEHIGIAAAEISRLLEEESGLKGLTGTGDLRQVLDRRRAGDARAALGYEIYVHRLVTAVGAMAAAAGGLAALAFTGGVGENSAALRADVASRLAFLGVAIDEDRNADGLTAAATGRPGIDISATGAAAPTLVVASREDLQMVRELRALVAGER